MTIYIYLFSYSKLNKIAMPVVTGMTISRLLLCPNKLLIYITDVTTENNCEEQQPDDWQLQSEDKQPATNSEAGSSSRQLKLEDPELADRSSQSSFVSVDGTGKYIELFALQNFVFKYNSSSYFNIRHILNKYVF